MNTLLVLLPIIVALACFVIALDWRSPLLFAYRSQVFTGLIVAPLVLVLIQILTLWLLRGERPALRVGRWMGLVVASLALIVTLAVEARFRWERHQVLHADPTELEQVGRHVILGFSDPKEVQELVKRRAVAGLYLTSRNIQGKSVAEIRREIDSLQRIRQAQGLPRLWIASDQEGGIVSRMSPPLVYQPPLSEVAGRYLDPTERKDAVVSYAGVQGRGLATLGVNLNFAPVVDVNHGIVNPDDQYSRIHQRAISDDPEVITQVTRWYCAALENAGVRCTLKHFPGLGRVFEDTHRGSADLTTTISELSETDWVPFRTLMRETHAFTMLGHARLTQIDPDLPVSLSPAVISGLIRGQWKYDGVLITDSFSMLAVYYSSLGMTGGSIAALNAGVDLILISFDPDQYYRVMYALLLANRHGKLDRDALQQSDRRLAHAIKSMKPTRQVSLNRPPVPPEGRN